METVWVSKGDDTRLIERKQLSMYKEQGFEKCPEPDLTPADEEPEKPKTNLVTLYKEGSECQCDKSQAAAMVASGWTHEAATKGVTDGGNEQQGRSLDQEHGPGGHVEESVDDSGGIEQQPRERRHRSNRRKRGNDQDS